MTPSPSASQIASAKTDPALLAVIKHVGKPHAVPPLVEPPSEIPGQSGLLNGARTVVGMSLRGVEHWADLRDRYGDVHRASLFHLPMVVVWDADTIQSVLRNEDHTWSAAIGWIQTAIKGLDPRPGNSGALVTLDFDEHRVARKIVAPAFTPVALEGYVAIAEERFTAAIDEWVRHRHVSFKAEVRPLLARVAGEIFTGIVEPQKMAVIDRALYDFWHGVLAMPKSVWLSPTFRRARRGLATLLETFIPLVPERRRGGGRDLFSRLCQMEDRSLSDEEIVRALITVMFGAFDTTAAGFSSIAYFLGKHLGWQERVREEARAISVPRLDLATLKSLKELEWVWKETQRLMPVLDFTIRAPLREVHVGGYALKPGTLVRLMSGGMGRHPNWWTAPSKFDPGRFERGEDKRHPAIFNPFGMGAHACVGMQLANLEAKVLFSSLLRRCRFRLAPDYEGRPINTPQGTVSGAVRLRLDRLT